MKILLQRLIKTLSVFFSYFLTVSEPFVYLLKRFYSLSKAQSKVKFSIPVTSQFDGGLQILGTGNVSWGEHCRFGKDIVLETQGGGTIEIGDNVRINQGSVLVSHNKIIIGDNCLIGEYCSIRDANHNTKLNTLIRKQSHSHAPITIEDDCWITRGVTVLNGTHLSHGCVIGANSVVTRDIPQNSVAVGSPAKVIRVRET